MLVAACSGSDDPDSSGSGTPTPTAATTSPTPVPTPSLGPDFSGEQAHQIVETLADDIGVRLAGSDGETRAAEFLRDTLASYGYDTEIQRFPFESVLQYETALRVPSQQRTFAASAMGGTESGAAEAEIVVAGIGRPDEFPPDSAGKLALIERGTLLFREKAQNAADAGAIAALIYNNESGSFIGRLDEDVTIPVVSLPQQEGLDLVDLVEQGPVSASLSVEVTTAEGESSNVVATPPEGECTVIVGGHLDSVANGPGANDNGSGTAVVVELARVLATDGEFGDVCFVLFGAEEIGLLGSAHYVETLTDLQRLTIRAMLNFDMLGVGNAWPIGGARSVTELIGDAAEAIALDVIVSTLPAGVGSDHASFDAVGIPAAIINCFCDANYHTAQDVPEFVRPERLQEAGELGLATIESLLAPR